MFLLVPISTELSEDREATRDHYLQTMIDRIENIRDKILLKILSINEVTQLVILKVIITRLREMHMVWPIL